MKTQINHEKFLEIVGRLENQPGVPEQVKPLVARFREVGRLMQKFQEAQEMGAKEAAWQELQTCQNQVSEAFAEMCSQFGMTPEGVRDHIENSANYDVKEWEEIQEVKRDVDSAVKEEKQAAQRGANSVSGAKKLQVISNK